jgi:hypothetical protein
VTGCRTSTGPVPHAGPLMISRQKTRSRSPVLIFAASAAVCRANVTDRQRCRRSSGASQSDCRAVEGHATRSGLKEFEHMQPGTTVGEWRTIANSSTTARGASRPGSAGVNALPVR